MRVYTVMPGGVAAALDRFDNRSIRQQQDKLDPYSHGVLGIALTFGVDPVATRRQPTDASIVSR